METGLHELPLVFFTVLAQTAVGAFFFIAMALTTTNNLQYRNNLYKAIFVLLVMLGLGVFASTFHLGSPLRAFNSLNKVGSSMLSNEIAAASVFSMLLGGGWLLRLLGKLPHSFEKIWLAVTAIAGLVFMYIMTQVYHIRTVPTWDNMATTLSFYLTVIVSGGVLGYTLLSISAGKTHGLSWIVWVVMVGILMTVIVVIYQAFILNEVHYTIKSMSDVLAVYPKASAFSFVGLAIATALLVMAAKKPSPVMTYAVLATVFVFASEILLRILFYALHTTVGMA